MSELESWVTSKLKALAATHSHGWDAGIVARFVLALVLRTQDQTELTKELEEFLSGEAEGFVRDLVLMVRATKRLEEGSVPGVAASKPTKGPWTTALKAGAFSGVAAPGTTTRAPSPYDPGGDDDDDILAAMNDEEDEGAVAEEDEEAAEEDEEDEDEDEDEDEAREGRRGHNERSVAPGDDDQQARPWTQRLVRSGSSGIGGGDMRPYSPESAGLSSRLPGAQAAAFGAPGRQPHHPLAGRDPLSINTERMLHVTVTAIMETAANPQSVSATGAPRVGACPKGLLESANSCADALKTLGDMRPLLDDQAFLRNLRNQLQAWDQRHGPAPPMWRAGGPQMGPGAGGRLLGPGGRDFKPPPQGYTCRICGVPGHWIQQCPTIEGEKGSAAQQQQHGMMLQQQRVMFGPGGPPGGFPAGPGGMGAGRPGFPPHGTIMASGPVHGAPPMMMMMGSGGGAPPPGGGPKPPPAGYLCKICKIPGHWIDDCPEKNSCGRQKRQREEHPSAGAGASKSDGEGGIVLASGAGSSLEAGKEAGDSNLDVVTTTSPPSRRVKTEPPKLGGGKWARFSALAPFDHLLRVARHDASICL